MTTGIIILVAAAILYGYAAVGPRAGLWPFRGRLQAVGDHVWYEAATPIQIAHVLHAWKTRIAALEREGRSFVVPERRKGCTTWDDRVTWDPYAKGLAVRTHFLRVGHNHWRHDMDNDAVVIEFATEADRDTFLSRIPVEGPTPFDFADALGTDGRARLETLLAVNRARTDAEAA